MQLFFRKTHFALALALLGAAPAAAQTAELIGKEVSVSQGLEDGDEFELSVQELLERGEALFRANWTPQEGGGRPLSKGTGPGLSDPGDPLVFPRNFNRVSARDANSCFGCHNAPFGFAGGGGDFVTGVFVAAQRFDFATFDHSDPVPAKGALNEAGEFVVLSSIGNYRATTGMFGSGYYEMLARQITEDLRAIRDGIGPGESAALTSKGISFGILARNAAGDWDVSGVEGLPAQSLATSGGEPPSLIIHPWHQSGSVVSLRQFTNNAFNHHHGMQSAERFGDGVDADGDGFTDELTRAEITAASVFQAAMPVPGQVIPNDIRVEHAVFRGERIFRQIGCNSCHIEKLPLDEEGWIYTEPNPFNPDGNLQPGEAQTLSVDLSSGDLPGHRLKPENGVVWVPLYTDFKLHDITTGPDDPGAEAIDINQPGGSPGFLAGNTKFLTKRLWGAANEPPYFHHGKFTTLREAILAHRGEAEWTRDNFLSLSGPNQDRLIEFLKSLQVLPPGVEAPVVDENGEPKLGWPPASFPAWQFIRGSRP